MKADKSSLIGFPWCAMNIARAAVVVCCILVNECWSCLASKVQLGTVSSCCMSVYSQSLGIEVGSVLQG